jgi:hypothetical protein
VNEFTERSTPKCGEARPAKKALAGQFSLRAMLMTTAGFGTLFGVCSALRLPPVHVLAAFLISGGTATITIGILQSIGRCGMRYAPSQHWDRCNQCLQKRYVYPNGRCHECCLSARDR